MAAGKPKPRRGKSMLAWRSRQKPGSIMSKETFEGIKKSAEKGGIGKERATKAAGAAYWKATRAKFGKRRK